MRRTIALAAVLVMAAAACSTNSSTGTTPIRSIGNGFDASAITFRAALTPFDACDAVLAHFKAEALERVGPYGLEGGGPYWPFFGEGDVAIREEAGTDGAPPTTVAVGLPTAGGDDSSFSGTNVQVLGVDEPDIVKTDGDRILSIVNGVLRYVDVSGDEPVVLGELRLESGWDHRFFVSGDRAFIFSHGDIYAIPMFAADTRIMPPYGSMVSVVQEIELSDPSDMEVVRTLRIDGSYLSARAIDGTVRMVVSSYPSQLPFVYPSNQAAEDIALEANRRIIQESTLDTWVPSYTVYDADGDEIDSGYVVACNRMHRPAEFAGFDTLSVTTLDLGGPLGAGNGTGVIAKGETVYASTSNLYVSTNVWIPSDAGDDPDVVELSERYETQIHKFDISGDGPATYRASGSVSGHLLNQFSMDELDGNLRVAVTEGAPWAFRDDAESKIVVLAERDGVLAEIGSVGDMGKGERIYSVRFIGEAAYVVTFRQVDPLYVVDLSDPAAPSVSGELKIPGYSAYLHPLGDGMILGVGQDADDDGRTLGAKATLFDVSDPSNPRELSSWRLADAYTDVEWDHLAFLYWAPEDLVVLPIQSWQTRFFGAVVLKTDDGLREYGRITHARDASDPGSDCQEVEPGADYGVIIQLCGEDDIGGYGGYACEVIPADDFAGMGPEYGIDLSDIDLDGVDRVEFCWPNYDGDPQILRSLVIGDTLWTLSWNGLPANAIDGLEVTHTIGL